MVYADNVAGPSPSVAKGYLRVVQTSFRGDLFCLTSFPRLSHTPGIYCMECYCF